MPTSHFERLAVFEPAQSQLGLAPILSGKKCVIFAGALWAESVKTLNDVLRIASSLGQYEFIEGVITDKELGGCLEVWP